MDFSAMKPPFSSLTSNASTPVSSSNSDHDAHAASLSSFLEEYRSKKYTSTTSIYSQSSISSQDNAGDTLKSSVSLQPPPSSEQVIQTTHPDLPTITTPFHLPDTSHLSQCSYLMGNPIAHSSSPLLHRHIYQTLSEPQYDWAQVLCETDDLPSFIRHLRTDPKAFGSGVTMPCKVAVIPYLDELVPTARAVGAVNTIHFQPTEDGKRRLVGSNTDVLGIRDAVLHNAKNSDWRGRPGLIVGGGGTCRAAVYALKELLGCRTVYIVNRDEREVNAVIEEYTERGAGQGLAHIESVEEVEALDEDDLPGLVISCVPDFEPVTEEERRARRVLETFLQRRRRKDYVLLEMCYHPSPNTAISRIARGLGWQVIGGLEAMISQGIAQAQLWLGLAFTDEMRRQIGARLKTELGLEVEASLIDQ